MSHYLWRDGWCPAEPAAGEVACADSWRHVDGRAHGFSAHARRFERCAGPLPPGFWARTARALDSPGEFFPRVALAGGEIRLDIRPAPPARATSVLALSAAPDPRTKPLIKGPDLHRLSAFRARHTPPGADDVILGDFAETTTGALVGWEGSTLVVPRGVRLPSVTQAQVIGRARERGISVREGRLHPGMPLWFLNSLHGVSPVTSIVGGGARRAVPAQPGAAEWAAWWWEGFRSAG